MSTDDDPEGGGRDPNAQWARVAADLRAYRAAQQRDWGDLDEAAIARYLGDEATEEERSRVEQAMRDYPKVRECVEVLREVVTESQAPSKWRIFSPSSVRRLAPYAIAACLLVVVGLPLFMSWSHNRPLRDLPPTETSDEVRTQIAWSAPRGKSAEAKPQIVAMIVEQYRGEGDQTKPIGTLGVDSPAAQEKDLVRVSARLDRPAYCYVIAFNPDGHDQLYYPADRDVPPPKSAKIDYPDGEGYFPLTDGAGLQAFVVVASNDPLPPYERWRSILGEVPWQATQGDGVWRSDGRGLELAMADRPAVRGGPTAPPEPPPRLSQLPRFLATRPGVATVRALAFPVKPERAEVTPQKTDRGDR
jgi:hypothetical protein